MRIQVTFEYEIDDKIMDQYYCVSDGEKVEHLITTYFNLDERIKFIKGIIVCPK